MHQVREGKLAQKEPYERKQACTKTTIQGKQACTKLAVLF
jgi:hypothetical protein